MEHSNDSYKIESSSDIDKTEPSSDSDKIEPSSDIDKTESSSDIDKIEPSNELINWGGDMKSDADPFPGLDKCNPVLDEAYFFKERFYADLCDWKIEDVIANIECLRYLNRIGFDYIPNFM